MTSHLRFVGRPTRPRGILPSGVGRVVAGYDECGLPFAAVYMELRAGAYSNWLCCLLMSALDSPAWARTLTGPGICAWGSVGVPVPLYERRSSVWQGFFRYRIAVPARCAPFPEWVDQNGSGWLSPRFRRAWSRAPVTIRTASGSEPRRDLWRRHCLGRSEEAGVPSTGDRPGPVCREIGGSVGESSHQEFPVVLSPERSDRPSANRKRPRAISSVFQSIGGTFGR